MNKKQLNCFIIMPFTSARFKDNDDVEHTLNEKELKHIYDELFVKAVKSYSKNDTSFVNVHRSNAKRGNFVKDIVGKLQDYDLVIADLTGSNPNVFYELGIRHTLTNGTIMITRNVSHLPSDLKSYIGVEYKYYKTAVEFDNYYPEFEKKLHSLIDDVLEDKQKIDNPVREFIGDRIIFRNEERIKEIEGNIKLMKYTKDKYTAMMDGYINTMQKWSEGDDNFLPNEGVSKAANAFYAKLIHSNEKLNIIEFLESLLSTLENISTSMPPIKALLKDKKELNITRDYDFFFIDNRRRKHHILDLMRYYERLEHDEFRKQLKDINEELRSSLFDKIISILANNQNLLDEYKNLKKHEKQRFLNNNIYDRDEFEWDIEYDNYINKATTKLNYGFIGFKNYDNEMWAVLIKKEEPILQSFNYFIDEWEKELKELTKQ